MRNLGRWNMVNNKKMIYALLAVIVALFCVAFKNNHVSAVVCYDSNGYVTDCSNTEVTAGSCDAECMSKTIISSASTDAIQTTKEFLESEAGESYRSFPAITIGSQSFDAVDLTDALKDMAEGSTVYIHAIVAQNRGDITYADGTTKHVEKGDLITYIPAGGMGSFSLPGLGGGRKLDITINNLPEGMSQISEAAMAAIYNRLVAEGKLAYRDNMYAFNDFIKKLKELAPPEIKELLDELCKEGFCKPPKKTKIPDCHEEHYWGDTIGSVSVQNMTQKTGWQKAQPTAGNSDAVVTIWAKPGDSIQFKVDYCWGAQAVYGDDYNPARTEYVPWTGGIDNIYFRLSAERSDAYLFGEKEQTIGSSKHVLTKPHNDTIGAATAGAVPNSAVDETGDYTFTVYSPGQDDDANYNCMIFDFPPNFYTPGYQIPGVETGGCAAISQVGNMSDVSNDAGIIKQKIEYDQIQAWVLHSHDATGECDSVCNYDNYGHYTNRGTTKKRNSLTTKNDNKLDEPYADLEAAKAHGGAEWGIVLKHKDDTLTHKQDCNKSSCGRSNPRRTYEYSCKKDDGSSDICTDTESVAYDSGCVSGTKGTYCTYYSYPGTQYFEPQVKAYTEHKGKDIHPVNLGHKSATAEVNVPYNYRTQADSFINEGQVIYLGESVTSTFTASIKPRVNTSVQSDSYATLVPGFVQAVEFITDSAGAEAAKSQGGTGTALATKVNGDLCNYFSHKNGECKEVWREGPGLNKEGRYDGADYSKSVTRAVPDNRDDLVGDKYCVAVGISKSDSHNQPDNNNHVSGMSQEPIYWRISGVSCRTIAKKPTFQVWNGGLYTNGSIKTSRTSKLVGTGLLENGESYPGADRMFGSWEEYYVVAAKEVKGFASGAALGYSPHSFKLSGGKSEPDKVTYCDLTKMTIANTKCNDGLSGKSGESGILNISQNIILERIYSRYAIGGANTTYVGHTLDENGARYIYKGTDNIKISEVVKGFHSDEMKNSDYNTWKCNSGTNALRMCQGESAGTAQTTSNYADGTLVIYTGGKVTIDTNICYGKGDCGNNSEVVKLDNNNELFTSMYGIPQVLIIAEGGIDITKNVTQVDAWLITNGNIDTCTDFKLGGEETDCKTTLMVNGPVFAKSMSLNRTGGAYPGSGTSSTVLKTNLAKTGSITPGEIFNLRPDTLYWAYSQAQRFTQATVTYTRELAPRY